MGNAKILQDKLSCFLKKEESLENLYNYLKNDKKNNPEELEKIQNLTKIRLEEMIKIKNDLIAFLNGRFLSLYEALSWYIENLDKEFKIFFDDENDD